MAEQPLIHAGFGMPERQNRWSVAFRSILAIPQSLVVLVLGVAALVVVVVGWFAALVLGRLPAGMARFLSNFLRYWLRVTAYSQLMLDDYPPFSFSGDYPVDLDIPVTPLRRLAVLFRFVLLIPAAVVSGLASIGMGIAGIVIWVVVLVAGRMPPSLFAAESAVLRFQARYSGYAWMLTSTYPGGIFGDTAGPAYAPSPTPGVPAPPSAVPSAVPPPPPPAPPYPGAPGAPAQPGDPGPLVTPSDPAAPSGYWQPRATTPVQPPEPPSPSGVPPSPDEPPPPDEPPAPDAPSFVPLAPAPPARTGGLVLSTSAKRIVVTFIVLGVLGYGALVAVPLALGSGISANESLVEAHDTLGSQISAAEGRRAACQASQTECIGQYWSSLQTAFATFDDRLGGISFSGHAQADASRLESATTALVAELRMLAAQPSATTQDAVNQVQSLANTFDTDFRQLVGDLP